jgi:hypothetical protein
MMNRDGESDVQVSPNLRTYSPTLIMLGALALSGAAWGWRRRIQPHAAKVLSWNGLTGRTDDVLCV